MPYDVDIEILPPGQWIGDDRVQERAANDWVLITWGTLHTDAAHTLEPAPIRYLFYRIRKEMIG